MSPFAESWWTMDEFPQVSDDDLDRLTDGEPFAYTSPETVTCSCRMTFVSIACLVDLLTELSESCISDQKQMAYRGLRTLVREWRDNER